MIQVTTNEANQREITYFPRLMQLKSDKSIFLFLAPTCAVCLVTTRKNGWYEGEYYDRCDQTYYTDYNEPVTIQNL